MSVASGFSGGQLSSMAHAQSQEGGKGGPIGNLFGILWLPQLNNCGLESIFDPAKVSLFAAPICQGGVVAAVASIGGSQKTTDRIKKLLDDIWGDFKNISEEGKKLNNSGVMYAGLDTNYSPRAMNHIGADMGQRSSFEAGV